MINNQEEIITKIILIIPIIILFVGLIKLIYNYNKRYNINEIKIDNNIIYIK